MPRFICIYVYIELKKTTKKTTLCNNKNRMMFVCCFQKLSNLVPPDGIHRGVEIVDLGLGAEHTFNLKICMHLGQDLSEILEHKIVTTCIQSSDSHFFKIPKREVW